MIARLLSITSAVILSLTIISSADAQSKPTTRPSSQPAKKAWSPRKDCAGDYGKGLSNGKRPTPSLKALLSDTKKYEGKTIRVQGTIQDVCQKKGCWLLLTSDKKTMRVRFKDYKFFVPTNAKGYIVTLEGHAKATEISEKMAKHYAEESGDKEASKKIKGPQKTVAFTATGLKLEKPKK
jgi:hypothetical protein